MLIVRYVFVMKKENQSGCGETMFQSGRVKAQFIYELSDN